MHQSLIDIGVAEDNDSNQRSEISIVNDLSLYLAYTGQGNDVGGAAFPYNPNGWHAIVCTKYETNVTFYLDGTFLNSGTTQPGQNVTSQILFIGWNGYPDHFSGEQFYGAIDDVRIYNRALSTNEVQQLYAYESQPIVSLRKAVSPSFSNLFIGTNYQLQVSTDLNTWTNNGSPFTPTNAVMDYPQYFDVEDWGQLFFRLQATP